MNAFRTGAQAAFLAIVMAIAAIWGQGASAAPFAAYVMDGRTGQTLYAQNADTPLHPASLTKMMTLYLAFAAVEQGRVRLDSRFTVTPHAASMPPSRLGLRPGQQIELRYLIRAAAVKSANDAATVICEGLGGSEAQFAAQMNGVARALGMRNSRFRNCNGLSADGHYSSAHDLTILGRHLFYDFPQYYSIFSRRSADAGIAQVASTNARFLDSYAGADGIKTGYTRAAGFNLTASAQRGSKRIMATVMGGTSTANRNQIMAQLLDAGFGRSAENVAVAKPQMVIVQPERVRRATVVAQVPVQSIPAAAPVRQPAVAQAPVAVAAAAVPAKKTRTAAAPTRTAAAKPAASPGAVDMSAALREALDSRPARVPTRSSAKGKASSASTAAASVAAKPAAAKSAAPAAKTIAGKAPPSKRKETAKDVGKTAAVLVPRPAARPEGSAPDIDTTVPEDETAAQAPATDDKVQLASAQAEAPQVRVAHDWGVSLGRYRSEGEAQQLLLKAALRESSTLGSARQKVAETKRGWLASFTGMTEDEARLACDKLTARSQTCSVLTP